MEVGSVVWTDNSYMISKLKNLMYHKKLFHTLSSPDILFWGFNFPFVNYIGQKAYYSKSLVIDCEFYRDIIFHILLVKYAPRELNGVNVSFYFKLNFETI